jgi:hypothetical protein
MAQKVQVILVDDIDGGTADETVSFSLDGVSYEIDLSTAHADELREALARYVGVARRVGGRSTAGRGRRAAAAAGRPSARKSDIAEVREWARQQGHKVNDRGRIPATIMEAYEKAHA